ncbi:MAG: hypothetical protein OXI87_19550 [Albidovulum sp.]|nr:hypothetical protein [Albidovulum sp.]
MPWELGYFDGLKGKVGVVPVTRNQEANFKGEKFLNLYPYVDGAKETGSNIEYLWIKELSKRHARLDLWTRESANTRDRSAVEQMSFRLFSIIFWFRIVQLPRVVENHLRIQHIPVIAQDPSQSREFPIEHSPFEFNPWSKILEADVFFGPLSRVRSLVPYTIEGLVLAVR